MNEQDFLIAINRNPEDPNVWLVYADWLEERGSEKAEFIRMMRQRAAQIEELEKLERQIRDYKKQVDQHWIESIFDTGIGVDIELNCGRAIYMRGIEQGSTYEGMLEGIPSTMFNRLIVERITEVPEDEEPCHLVEPVITELASSDVAERLGRAESLPGVYCKARFTSFQPAREEQYDFSWLTIVWFQDDFAFPIQSNVLDQIRQINWADVAGEGNY